MGDSMHFDNNYDYNLVFKDEQAKRLLILPLNPDTIYKIPEKTTIIILERINKSKLELKENVCLYAVKGKVNFFHDKNFNEQYFEIPSTLYHEEIMPEHCLTKSFANTEEMEQEIKTIIEYFKATTEVTSLDNIECDRQLVLKRI